MTMVNARSVSVVDMLRPGSPPYGTTSGRDQSGLNGAALDDIEWYPPSAVARI